MSTYKPEYMAGLINSQLSLIVEKVQQGIITDSQAIHTMALIQDGISEALADIRTHFEANTPTVKVDEYRIEEHKTCVQCSGKGRVWHPGCGDTDEPCMQCEGTGYNLDSIESCISCEGCGFNLDMRVY